MALILLGSSFAMANTEVYRGTDCVIVKEKRSNGSVFYIETSKAKEVVGLADDLSFGTFAYCSDKALQIHSFEGRAGKVVMLSCDEHQNGVAVTRGRVDLEIVEGNLKSLSIDGQVKKLFRWKQDIDVQCSNLVKQ